MLKLGGIVILTYVRAERLREKEVVRLFTAVCLLFDM